MDELTPQQPAPALSFGAVADAYDRARPSYPVQAAAWLVASDFAHVLELGAGTGRLTEQVQGLGHRVVATDPLEPMLRHLVARLPRTRALQATAERIPLRARSVDSVVCAQAFHWFDAQRALPEIARVLRPGGRLGVVWNVRDDRIPWVRRLGALIGTPEQQHDPTNVLLGSHLFGFVESTTYRFWQKLDRAGLRDLVTSRSNIAVLPHSERDRVLEQVDALYEEYGRGADGMLMPYVTHCYRAVVRPPALAEDGAPRGAQGARGDARRGHGDDDEPDALLIDFS
ncbi:MAG TPA: class I SAM-dependent methyltransferase [Nocardioidaceae bacterium]|nr:class I SAM-dependent methyltransferase [Nocardioidaceae bacterium]